MACLDYFIEFHVMKAGLKRVDSIYSFSCKGVALGDGEHHSTMRKAQHERRT